MPEYQNLKIHIVPAFETNYIFIAQCLQTNIVFAVDPGDFSATHRFLQENNLKLDYILNTHHHHDHIGGNLKLKDKYGCKIYGFNPDSARIPGIDIKLGEGEVFKVGEAEFEVIFAPGHTLRHIIYFNRQNNVAFVGDVLFSSGCGRLFEGSYEQAFGSLQKIKKLPPETQIYCAHEYTVDNIEFSLSLEPDNENLLRKQKWCNELRQKGLFTIPTKLELELQTNPFLRASGVEEFKKIRILKDRF